MTASSLATPSPLVSLFHDPAGTAFADLTIESHRETWSIRSQRLRSWLRRCHYQATGEDAKLAAIRFRRSAGRLAQPIPSSASSV
jgi:hypothetical protein